MSVGISDTHRQTIAERFVHYHDAFGFRPRTACGLEPDARMLSPDWSRVTCSVCLIGRPPPNPPDPDEGEPMPVPVPLARAA